MELWCVQQNAMGSPTSRGHKERGHLLRNQIAASRTWGILTRRCSGREWAWAGCGWMGPCLSFSPKPLRRLSPMAAQNDFLGLEHAGRSSGDFATESLKWQGYAGRQMPLIQTQDEKFFKWVIERKVMGWGTNLDWDRPTGPILSLQDFLFKHSQCG